MALFQPTNVIPSSFTQGTVDAVKDNMEISWQVNGNSAMTAFQIDFYLNDTASTPVYSTGKLPKAGEAQAKYNLPFYGTDRFGRPQFFTYNAPAAWEDYGFTNGNNYKFKIKQFYRGGTVYLLQPTQFPNIGNAYFSLVNPSGNILYVSFFPPIAQTNGVTITYNLETDKLVIVTPTNTINVNSTQSTVEPTNETYLGEAIAEVGLEQTNFSTFITRDTPTLSLQISDNENFTNPVALGDTLATSIGYFVADYRQKQNDAIRWIRWQVATANNGAIGEILVDTGDIYTPTLNFEFNGFFNGNQYAICCFGESESGQLCDTEWHFFTINIENQGEYTGTFTAQCLHKENATLLKWDSVTVIPPTVSPEDYKPTPSSGSVTLNANSSITWNKVGAGDSLENMSFDRPWTAVWKGKINLLANEQRIFVSGPVNNQRLYNGELYWYYSDTYTLTPTITKILKTQITTSSDAIYELVPQQTESGISATIYIMTKTRFNAQGFVRLVSAEIVYTLGEPLSPKDKIFSILSNADEMISINQSSDTTSNQFTVAINGTENIIHIQDVPTEVAFIVSPNNLTAYFYSNNTVLYQQSIPLTYTQQPITSVSIFGGDSGC